MNALTITNLSKTYADGTQALKSVDVTVQAGDFFALLGANGAGKTTIIGILTGLVTKTGGKAKVFDYDIDEDLANAKGMIGVVPQEMNFNMFEKVIDVVVTQAGFYGIPRLQALKDAERLLKRLELWEKRNTVSRSLSGGMKRRLMIARALVNNPKLLILDEPTAGVDVELRHSMWEFLKELNREGMTILMTTHYLEEVEQMCRNAAMIRDGEIIKNDSVRNLLNLVDKESFIVHVESIKNFEQITKYEAVKIDDHTFEVDLDKREQMTAFLSRVIELGMIVTDLRPKGNRMEKLFLNLLNE